MTATFGTNGSDGSGLTVPIIESFRHPLYKKKGHLYDVGLFKLEKPVKRKMAKLCAADGSDNKPYLKQLTVPVISNAECGKFKKYVGRVTEGMLCAGMGDGKDTCNGDSGGPLIVDDDIIIGCVSWGSKCGEQAGIYTRLTYVMNYIKDILAGGDGSKFNATSSSSGSMEEVSLPSSAGGSSSAATKTPVQESSESGSAEDQSTKKPTTKATKTPVAKEGSESGSDDLSGLFASDSNSASGSSDVPAWLLKYFEGSGSADLAWLFTSDSDSGRDSAIGSESAWEESGSEDAVLEKDKTIKDTKVPAVENSQDSPVQQTSVENESASTSGSESDESDLVHQSEQSEPTTIKQK
ncbi:hypothetical protein PF008_g28525 [Phytophthora fragariae]|uniref:Peptidase S1 domain-containing protein n=1 Tax=Phytophthora fragariae TaxID=53985 RepID=A0A6G0QBV4_9STRA|nr:hypothetical protein PF008_g28525 [Phytophthora fragariae]